MSIIPPIERAAEPAFMKIMQAIARPAIPELEQRGTAAAPAVLEEAIKRGTGIGQHAAEVPFGGVPELQAETRATLLPEEQSLTDMIQTGKETLGSFFRSDPNLPKDIQQILYKGRWRSAAARNVADRTLRKVYEPLTTDPVKQSRVMNDWLITADEVAQAVRSGKDSIRGKPLSMWKEQMQLLNGHVRNDPEMIDAIQRRRDLWDNIFEDMLARGWSIPEYYLEDYTPIRKLRSILEGLAGQGGEKFSSKLLSSMMHRTGEGGIRETNLLLLEHDILEDYFRKVAEDDAFQSLIADPTVNMTDNFRVGDLLPRGLRTYRPGAGMVGYMPKSAEMETLDGMAEGLDLPRNMLTPGSYVFPEPLVRALENYHSGHSTTKLENAMRTGGRTLARWWTVYNPINTRLNMLSDLVLAMHGLPGEKAQPAGILKWYGPALKAAYKGAFEKGKSLVKIGDQTVDLWEMVEKEGLAESTLFNQVQGQHISNELSRLLPEAERSKQFVLFDVMQRDRLGTELAPRIAAGLEAWERTGNIEEFGRVGREITLTYGAGAPLASRMPIIRILSPFIQFIGLASGRVFDLLKTDGSRNRTLASIMAIPTVTWMWNNQNPEFREVEDALSERMRDQAHIIVPDPTDPSKPRRDTAGRPLVLPFRYSVPEEVMKMAGLGNLASRLNRMARGRQTPQQFGADVAKRAVTNIAETLTLTPGFLTEALTGKTDTGQDIKAMDRITRLLPVSRVPIEAMQDVEQVGGKEAALRAGLKFMGSRPMNVVRRGDVLTDVDLMNAKRKVSEARAKYRRAITNEGPSAVKDAEKAFNEAIANLERVVAATDKEGKANAK